MPARASFSRVFLATAIVSALPVLAGATEQSRAEPVNPNLETCTKAVNVLGATMGHSEFTDADGHMKYKFKLRTSGLDYDAICDATTGVVGDVSPHRATTADDQAG